MKQTTRTGEPTRLMDWKAKRAGAAITIEGVDRNGVAHKVPGVSEIRGEKTGVMATDRRGHRFELA